MSGQLVISLDFELLWGMRDHADRGSYGANVLGAREAVLRMLDLFTAHGIRATWATVGFLFCESRDELIESLPKERPCYENPTLSNYTYLDEVGPNEAADPYYFAPSLIDRIAKTPGQEIGTHTLSHYYCLEDGQSLSAFEADLQVAIRLAERRGIELKSIVFPRNQFARAHLEVCARAGLTCYRGNPAGWAYRAGKGAEQTPLRRAMRLGDAYTGMLGAQNFPADALPLPGLPASVPASRFLRPCAGRLAAFHSLHLRTIKRGMTRAAETGTGYHLWWHPHNFGLALEANMAGLEQIVRHYAQLKNTHGFASRTMVEMV